jgi:16S rRNA (guanine966-N2)-methyltransferase
MTRVIAGELKGHRLAVPHDGVRPTSDRVREAIFNSLANKVDLTGKRVLDLYAGTGALAIESLSRGAVFALLVEADRKVATVTNQNLRKLQLDSRAELEISDASVWAKRPRAISPKHDPLEAPFDVVFIDPPYENPSNEITSLIMDLTESSWLAPECLLIVERSSKSPAIDWPPGVADSEMRVYGDTTIWYGLQGG